MTETRVSEAQKRAVKKYHDKFQQVKFYCEPDLYLDIKEYCDKTGESVSAFLKRVAAEEIARHPVSKNSAK